LVSGKFLFLPEFRVQIRGNDGLNADRITSMAWLALGLIAVYGSIELGLGTAHEPGSGFLPLLASLFVNVMALIIFFKSFGAGGKNSPAVSALWKGLRWKRTLAYGLITLGYILVFEWLGFALSTFLFLILLLKGMEKLPWRKVLLISAVSTGFCYLLLSISLESELPRGILGF
jgi:putative tricarboxylic transport membrane protein